MTAPPGTAGLRVWLVHDWLNGMRGGEKVLLELVRMFPRARVATLFWVKGATHPEIDARVERTSFLQKLPGVNRYYRNLLPVMWRAMQGIKLDACDLVISTSHCVAKAVRVPEGAVHLCYCFTPMRYIWEMQEHYLERRSLKGTVARALTGRLRRMDLASNTGVTRFAGTCENVVRRIERCYRRQADVIYPGIDAEFYVPADSSLPGEGAAKDFYLMVSALVPYKRVDLAVRAFTDPASRDRNLAIIGKGPEESRLKAMAGGAKNIRFLSWQEDEMVRWHYQHAKALLFPGEEDFGLTPIEAQACGQPVVAYGRGGVLETVTEKTGVFFREQTTDALLAALADFEAREAEFDPAVMRENALRFSWGRFREQILQTSGELLGRQA